MKNREHPIKGETPNIQGIAAVIHSGVAAAAFSKLVTFEIKHQATSKSSRPGDIARHTRPSLPLTPKDHHTGEPHGLDPPVRAKTLLLVFLSLFTFTFRFIILVTALS